MGAYPKSSRLRKSREFQALFKNSHQFHGKVLSISWRRTSSVFLRLGITVNKKQGDSVRRNRFKRLVRESFRLSKLDGLQGIDLNVRPRGRNATAFPPSFAEVLADFQAFFASFKA